jgi:hypothetical protein
MEHWTWTTAHEIWRWHLTLVHTSIDSACVMFLLPLWFCAINPAVCQQEWYDVFYKNFLQGYVGTSHKAPGVKSRPGYLSTKQWRNSGLVTWQRLPSYPTVQTQQQKALLLGQPRAYIKRQHGQKTFYFYFYFMPSLRLYIHRGSGQCLRQ